MSTRIYRTEDPALETVEFGAVYRVSDDCDVSFVDPLDRFVWSY